MNQQSVDELLAHVQAQAANITEVAAAAVGSGAPGAPTADVIAGNMGAPPHPAAHGAEDAALAGEFAPPPMAAARGEGEALNGDYRRLLSIEVPVIVQLGRRRMSVGEVMRLGVGAIVEFNKSADDELELLANNKPIGRGHAVKVGENFGIKISAVGTIQETIRKLGGQ